MAFCALFFTLQLKESKYSQNLPILNHGLLPYVYLFPSTVIDSKALFSRSLIHIIMSECSIETACMF